MSMNISPQNIAGSCNSKCELSFNYPKSTCTSTNMGNFIKLSYTDSSSPVTFNKIKYNITDFSIYCPSLHNYNNTKADAEIIISNTPSTGGNALYICIPISTNGTSNNASTIINEIITATSKGAPSQGESISQGITDFTLNDFIPMKEFYNYSNKIFDVIAFGMQNSIYLSQNNLVLLKKIIKSFDQIDFPSGPSLYINSSGPNNITKVSDDVFIDCQPTNESEEQINQVVGFKADTNFDTGITLSSIIFNPIFLILLCSSVFIILIILIHKGLKYISDE